MLYAKILRLRFMGQAKNDGYAGSENDKEIRSFKIEI